MVLKIAMKPALAQARGRKRGSLGLKNSKDGSEGPSSLKKDTDRNSKSMKQEKL